MFGTDTCWLGLRYVISRVMHSVFAPELWLEQNLMQINQSSELEQKTKKQSEPKDTNSLFFFLKANEKFQGLLNINYNETLNFKWLHYSIFQYFTQSVTTD